MLIVARSGLRERDLSLTKCQGSRSSANMSVFYVWERGGIRARQARMHEERWVMLTVKPTIVKIDLVYGNDGL